MEILSPVKNLENAKIAIASGADAIYFSSSVFGARSLAKNNHQEVKEIVEYARLHYVKTYVTLNTLIMYDEIALFTAEVNFLHSIGVDAIIVQDVAFISVIKSMFDDIEVHCSTQMNIGNSKAAIFVKNQGASRVVIPREISKEEIKKFAETGVETEVFVHGALCTSYSGICLISSFAANMSGNRGKCSQYCRMKTNVYKDEEVLNTDDYTLSFKDLNASESIRDLVDLGVSSFKIEGRLKQKEYVAVTTSVYRRIVDDKNYDANLLSKVYNREFTKGFLNNSKSSEINNSTRINNNGYYVGKIVKQDSKLIYIDSKEEIVHLDKLRFIKNDFETGQTVDVVEYENGYYKVKSRINNITGASVYVVASASISKGVVQDKYNLYKRRSYELEVFMNVGKCLEVVCNGKKYFSKSILEEAKTRALEEKDILKQLNKTKDYSFDFNIKLNYAPGFIRVSELNEIRRNIYEDIKTELLAVNHTDRNYTYITNQDELNEKKFYVEVSTKEQLIELKDLDIIIVINNDDLLACARKYFKTVYIAFSNIVEDAHIKKYLNVDQYDGVVVSEIGALEVLKDYNNPIITNYSFNTTNFINQQFLLNYVTQTMLSLECDYTSLNEFNLAYAVGFLYGRANVMNMKYCLLNKNKLDKCGECSRCCDSAYEIEINGERYPIMKQNYDKLSLLSSKPIYNKQLLNYNTNYYIRFTNEKNVDQLFENILNNEISIYDEVYLNKLN